MTRPISTRMHGIIDYAWTAAARSLPAGLDGAPSTAKLVRNAARAAAMNSMLTKYELGVVHVLPMKGHLAVDVALYSALLAAPLFLPHLERRYAAIPMVLGAIGLLTSLMTQTHSVPGMETIGREAQRQVPGTLEEDPDLVRSPHLRAHLE